MKRKKEIRLRHFEQAVNQRHIPGEDKFLYAQDAPTINIAVIGCGTIGVEHMRVIGLLGRACVKGIYDTKVRSVEVALDQIQQSELPRVYDSLEQACADSDIDAFIICTPNFTHLDVFTQVINSGKAVLLEKPMATTLQDAAEIVRLSEASAAPVQVGLQYRFKSIYQEASFELLQRRTVGEIKTIHLHEHRPPFLDKVEQWNKFTRGSGGTLVEKCCHYFDLLNHYANSVPVKVYAHGSQAVNFKEFEYAGAKSDIMDNAVVVIEYANQIRASFELVMFAPNFQEQMIVCGDKGRLTVEENFNVFQSQQSSSHLLVEHGENGARRKCDIAYPSFIEQSGHHGATYFEHIAFMDVIEGKPQNAADVTQGFASIVLGAAAEESVQTGQPVDVQAMLEEQGLSEFYYSQREST